jgi:predicted HicB family RNase H-like nuclease
MKRIIDGVTYNTDTSTRLAKSQYETLYNHESCECEATLFQTRGGAFFVHEKVTLWDKDYEDESTKNRFHALSANEAQAWMMTGEVEVFHTPFGEPPEAEAETESSATLYIRVPVSLKQRLDLAAQKSKLSVNSFMIRCSEKCLSEGIA